MSVETVTYTNIGECPSCGGTEFSVTAMVKTHAGVHLGEQTGHINIDTSDFHINLQETEADLETAVELLGTSRFAGLPEHIVTRIGSGDLSASRYVVIRCDGCGEPFDYGERQIILGYD